VKRQGEQGERGRGGEGELFLEQRYGYLVQESPLCLLLEKDERR